MDVPRTSESDASIQSQSKRTRRDHGGDQSLGVTRSGVFSSVEPNLPSRFVGDGEYEYESWWLDVQAYLSLFDLSEQDKG
jgi:hypothetical protein